MASIEDRWFVERAESNGIKTKVKTDRYGKGLRWKVHHRDPTGKQPTKSFAKKVDADRYLISIEASKLQGTYVEPSRGKMLIGELAVTWRAAKSGLKTTTRKRYDAALHGHVLPRWQNVQLARVEHGDIQGWVAKMIGAGLSGATIRKNFGVLSSILRLAVKDKRLAVNPAEEIDLPPPGHQRRKYLTAQQVTALADAAERPPALLEKLGRGGHYAQYRLVVLVLAYCGLRWSELAALRAGRVDLRRRRLQIEEAAVEVNGGRVEFGTPKNHERRSVPVPRLIAEMLNSHLEGKGPDDFVFTSPKGGVLRNRNARRDWFDDAAETIGEKGLTPHELRHTAASLAVSAGANVLAVQRLLGHKSAAMTLDTYADLFDSDLDAVADSLDKVARGAGVSPAFPKGPTADLGAARRMAIGQ
jgi:integrase